MRLLARLTAFALVAVLLGLLAWFPFYLRDQEPDVALPDMLVVERASFADLRGWAEDDQREGLRAFLRSCERLLRLDPGAPMGGAGIAGVVGDWRPACRLAQSIDVSDLVSARAFFEQEFEPVAVLNREESEGRFTGYYEPELRGAREKQGVYTVPLYSFPNDLVTVDLGKFSDEFKGRRIAGRVVERALEPYPDRSAIVAGAIDQSALPIVYVDSAVDA
jgi:membrane-bound lytic murein transglycosylase A